MGVGIADHRFAAGFCPAHIRSIQAAMRLIHRRAVAHLPFRIRKDAGFPRFSPKRCCAGATVRRPAMKRAHFALQQETISDSFLNGERAFG
jgi:hypothetical protein